MESIDEEFPIGKILNLIEEQILGIAIDLSNRFDQLFVILLSYEALVIEVQIAEIYPFKELESKNRLP
jgi:hypothetical protein